MWEKSKGTTKCEKRTITCDVGTTQCEDGTIKYEKRTVTCDVGIAQYEDRSVKCEKRKKSKGTIKCEKKVTRYGRLLTSGYCTPFFRGTIEFPLKN